jgi:hypothetical protein
MHLSASQVVVYAYGIQDVRTVLIVTNEWHRVMIPWIPVMYCTPAVRDFFIRKLCYFSSKGTVDDTCAQ